MVAAFLATPAGAQVAGYGLAVDQPLVTKIEPISANMASCGQATVRVHGEDGLPSCPFSDVTLGFKINSSGVTDSTAVEFYGAFAGGSRGALTAQRLLSPAQPGLGEAFTVAMLGMKSEWAEGRVNLTTELSRSESWLAPLHEAPLLFDRFDENSGWAQRHRLELKLVDSPDLRWSITGEASKVSDDYYIGSSVAIRRQVGPPGQRYSLASALKIARTRFTASFDSLQTSFGSSENLKFGMNRDGISLKFSSRNAGVEPNALTGYWESRTIRQSAFLDLDFNSISPRLASDRKGLALLLPTTLSLNWTRGRTDSANAGLTRSYRRGGWEFMGNWDTRFGETMVGYRRDEKVAITPGLRSTASSLIQASHSFRWNGWRFGIDGLVSTDTAAGSRAFDNRTISMGSTLAYSRPDGPEIRIRIGRDQGRMAMGDRSYLSSQSASSITAALDLSRYLQNRFERPDLNLRVELRKRTEATSHEIELFDETLERWLDSDNRQGLLFTFSMNL